MKLKVNLTETTLDNAYPLVLPTPYVLLHDNKPGQAKARKASLGNSNSNRTYILYEAVQDAVGIILLLFAKET